MPFRLSPDFSEYVVHFTKDIPPLLKKEFKELPKEIIEMTALERLERILNEKRILATPMPWTAARAVCFTECTWLSLLGHADQYSPYGLGFHKSFLFATGGGPAIYLRPDLFRFQEDYFNSATRKKSTTAGFHPKKIWPFITPFAPDYAPKEHMQKAGWKGGAIDYSQEREWRVPHDLTFDYSKIEFVIMDTYKDMAKFPAKIKDVIGRENFILMDNFRQIEKRWPSHKF